MKLATFSTEENTNPRLGAVRDDGIVDLGGFAGVPDTMLDLLRAGEAAMTAARAAAEAAAETVAAEKATYHPPVLMPGKILAIGLNYGDHIEESGMGKPKHQVWFNKQHNCVNGPYADIALPSVSEMLDYEAELVVIIGKRCKHVPRDRASEVIAGYCCGNDVSVRDWQMRAQTMQIGKSFDTHGPTGPWLVTADEVGDPHNLDISAEVNGELRQNSNTRHLIYDCYDAVAHLTQAFTLEPGDLLFMGTPAGVGAAMKPPQFLKAGDAVKVEIEKLGYLENRVVPEAAECVIE
ncbi:MAG: 5-carboxymethyl-2-hydroxymuconate isomerase [Pseudomonadales bacterium]|nr:fumarylacetoacetate hydrolase family protein [Pseudomonadales bacterium]NIX07440.1 5-carboxymethyl-2-hydroxymuconate isomerase [Pseudomonadales bacterium]